MKRHHHLAARTPASPARSSRSRLPWAPMPRAPEGALADTYAASELSITSDLSNVPDFTPVSPAKPYRVAWQNQLLSYQERFVLTLQIDACAGRPAGNRIDHSSRKMISLGGIVSHRFTALVMPLE